MPNLPEIGTKVRVKRLRFVTDRVMLCDPVVIDHRPSVKPFSLPTGHGEETETVPGYPAHAVVRIGTMRHHTRGVVEVTERLFADREGIDWERA